MKHIKQITALICIFALLGALAIDVFAASSIKGNTNTVTFTVVTSKKDSTLTVTPSSGKITATQWKNVIKQTTKTVTKSGIYGNYTVTVSGVGSKTMTSKKVTFDLNKNTTYKVTITYNGMSNLPTTYWDATWKKAPSWKASVNKSAEIK